VWLCGIHGWTKGHYFSHDCCPLFVCCRLILQRRIKYLIMTIIVCQLLRYLHSQGVVHKLLDIIRRISTSSSAKLPAPWWAEWLLIISSVLLHFHCFCTVQCIKLAFLFCKSYLLCRIFLSFQHFTLHFWQRFHHCCIFRWQVIFKFTTLSFQQ